MLLAALAILISWTSLALALIFGVQALDTHLRRLHRRQRLVAAETAAILRNESLLTVTGSEIETLTLAELRRTRRRAYYSSENRMESILRLITVDDYIDDEKIREIMDRQSRAAAFQRESVRMSRGEPATA